MVRMNLMRILQFLLMAAIVAAFAFSCGDMQLSFGKKDCDCPEGATDDDTASNEFPKIQDFTWTASDGSDIHLYDFEGTVLILGSAAGWCVSCKDEAPKLQKLYEDYQDQDFNVIILLTQDGAGNPAKIQNAKDWADEFNLSYIVGIDPDWLLSQYYIEQGVLPFSMILDRDLRIHYKTHEYNENIFRATIEEIL